MNCEARRRPTSYLFKTLCLANVRRGSEPGQSDGETVGTCIVHLECSRKTFVITSQEEFLVDSPHSGSSQDATHFRKLKDDVWFIFHFQASSSKEVL